MPTFLSLLVFALSFLSSPAVAPTTRVDNVKETLHGTEIVDPYRWLEDQKSPETRAWIDQQNAYTRPILDGWPGREKLKKRVAEFTHIDTISTPTERGGRYFFTKRLAAQDLPVICMRKGLKGPDEVLLDPHPMSSDHTTSVAMMGISRDGTELLYGIRKGGEDELTVHIRNVETRQDLADTLPRARYGGIAQLPDHSGMYYAKFLPGGVRVFWHPRNGDPAQDKEIFGQGYGPSQTVGVGLSESGRWLIFSGNRSFTQNDLYIQDRSSGGPVVPVAKGLDGSFSPRFIGDRLLLLSTWQAPHGRVLKVDPANPAPERWKVLIPESEDTLTGITPAGGKLFARYDHNATTRIQVFSADGTYERDLSLPGLGSAFLSGRWETQEAFLSFSSYHIPSTIYRYDVAKGTREIWNQVKTPVDSAGLEVRQVWYTSKDKTRIPMFLLHKKGLQPTGSIPVWITGYGGFNVSQTPGFNASAVIWAERGGIYAVANLRGGGEFGEAWHRAGMLEKKQNVFDDFIGAAEWFVANKYSKPSRLVISGGSNGGLLVGAAMTQRPDLYAAVVCSFPLLDMVRYQKFLIARIWVPEYGSADDEKQFPYLYAYSPYHHVKQGTKYPAVLFVSGDSDTRVDPLHARKMAARMQAANGGPNPILLHYETMSGHSGGQPASKRIEDQTDTLGFLLSRVER